MVTAREVVGDSGSVSYATDVLSTFLSSLRAAAGGMTSLGRVGSGTDWKDLDLSKGLFCATFQTVSVGDEGTVEQVGLGGRATSGRLACAGYEESEDSKIFEGMLLKRHRKLCPALWGACQTRLCYVVRGCRFSQGTGDEAQRGVR